MFCKRACQFHPKVHVSLEVTSVAGNTFTELMVDHTSSPSQEISNADASSCAENSSSPSLSVEEATKTSRLKRLWQPVNTASNSALLQKCCLTRFPAKARPIRGREAYAPKFVQRRNGSWWSDSESWLPMLVFASIVIHFLA